MKKNKKHLDFELNLIPFIDLLSTCICFLLLTAVWIQVGSINVKMSMGGQPQAETEKKAHIKVLIQETGAIVLDVVDSTKVSAKLRKLQVDGADGHPKFDEIERVIADIRGIDAGIEMALVQPNQETIYEDVVELMDRIKKVGVSQVGISPL